METCLLLCRAVKFIRDQALAHTRSSTETFESRRKARRATGIAAQAIKKILTSFDDDEPNGHFYEEPDVMTSAFDPMSGWSKDDVSLTKSHFCLLLKPQLILRSDTAKDSVVVLACVQASMQSFTVLDTANIEDPVTGKIMTRSAADLSGFQTFTPSSSCQSRHDGVPLEVLIDLRAESSDFDRLVPQTDAMFRYDKFNRLRLRNNVASMAAQSEDNPNSHLQHQTVCVFYIALYSLLISNSRTSLTSVCLAFPYRQIQKALNLLQPSSRTFLRGLILSTSSV